MPGFYRHAKADSKYMKYYDKNEGSSFLKYCDLNNFNGSEVLQKLLVNGFKRVENPQFNENFIEYYNGDSDEGYFLEVHVQYPAKLHDLHNDFFFLPEIMQIEKLEKFVNNMLFT